MPHQPGHQDPSLTNQSPETLAAIERGVTQADRIARRPRSAIPRATFADTIQSALRSAAQGAQFGSQFSQLGDPLSAALGGILGAAGGPTPQQIQAERQMQELAATPLGQVSPQLATFLESSGVSGASDLPIAMVQQFTPLIQAADQLQKMRDAVSQRGPLSDEQAKDFAKFMDIPEERAKAFGRLPASMRGQALQAFSTQERLASDQANRAAQIAQASRDELVRTRAQLQKELQDITLRFIDPTRYRQSVETLSLIETRLGLSGGSPQQTPPDTQPVTMVRPDGRRVAVDPSKVDAATKAGYRRE